MLLILSEPDDAHIPFITPKLEERGIEYVWFDPANFPAQAQLSIGFSSAGISRRTLRYQGREIDLSTVAGVWDRRPGLPQAHPIITEPSQRSFAEQASRRLIDGLCETLDARWLPGKPSAVRNAENKVLQLALAAQLGFTLSETLITTDPTAFLDFYASAAEPMISKSLVNVDVKRAGENHVVVFTHPVRRRDLANSQAIRYAPVIFQRYVPKDVELRVTVIGSQVFAVEIASQTSHLTRSDWRHYEDRTVRYAPHTLPPSVQRLCLELVRALGLQFGAIDLILTPDGEYVFLEINPNGQWGFIEIATGLPMAESVVDFFTSQTAAEVTHVPA